MQVDASKWGPRHPVDVTRSQMWHSRAEPCCMYIAIYYVQKNGGKVPQTKRPQLRHFVPGHPRDTHTHIYIYICVCVCLSYFYIYIYVYIYIYICLYVYIYIYLSLFVLYLYQHLYVCTSVCLQLSLRNCRFLYQMDAAGFEPAGGGERGGTGSRWKIISNQGGPKPIHC